MQELLKRAFERMGARVVVDERPGALRLDVRNDKKDEHFIITKDPDTEMLVLDVQPEERHLLLLTRKDGEKQRFLAGRDERHWFVASIPQVTPISTVRDAKAALKPAKIKESPVAKTIRQGEWFFIPRPEVAVNEMLVLHNEPLMRSRGSKPHRCEYLYRMGGETVYVSRHNRNGLTEKEYNNLDKEARDKHAPWQVMRRNPQVFVRGKVRHTDHKTITL